MEACSLLTLITRIECVLTNTKSIHVSFAKWLRELDLTSTVPGLASSNTSKIMPPKVPTPKLTHFLCLPLVTSASKPQLQKSVGEFRQAITNKSTAENPDGIPVRAIRPVGTLHLTLGVMSLLTPERLEGAMACLSSLDIGALLQRFKKAPEGQVTGDDGGKLIKSTQAAPCITLRGLKSMQSPASTSILYSAPEDPDGSLQALCQAIRDKFIQDGWVIFENRPLLLHATVLNTVYVPAVRRESGRDGHRSKKSKLVIDARTLLEDWVDFEWMRDVKVENVAICRMGAQRVEGEDDEEYVVEGSLTIP